MTTLRITTIDQQAAIVLPPEVVAHLNAKNGDELHAVALPGGLHLVRSADAAIQLQAAQQVMQEDHQVLRRLAE